jgi:PX domain-containing protein kinase-like protein
MVKAHTHTHTRTLACTQGSLKDLIYQVKSPKVQYSKKYRGVRAQGIAAESVRCYGRQMLEGLRALHDKGIAYGHLHTGNVMLLTDTHCQLSEIENGILQLPSVYRCVCVCVCVSVSG